MDSNAGSFGCTYNGDRFWRNAGFKQAVDLPDDFLGICFYICICPAWLADYDEIVACQFLQNGGVLIFSVVRADCWDALVFDDPAVQVEQISPGGVYLRGKPVSGGQGGGG